MQTILFVRICFFIEIVPSWKQNLNADLTVTNYFQLYCKEHGQEMLTFFHIEQCANSALFIFDTSLHWLAFTELYAYCLNTSQLFFVAFMSYAMVLSSSSLYS